MIVETFVNCIQDASLENMLDKPMPGIWLPFCFDMSQVFGIKMSSPDADSEVYNKTTIYTNLGDLYVVDIEYEECLEMFKAAKETATSKN